MTALLLCPRCTQSLPGDAVFCRRCGMSMGARAVKTPPLRVQTFQPAPTPSRPVRSGIGAWVMGLIFLLGFGFVLSSERHRIWSTSMQQQQPTWSAPVVGPGQTASGGWLPNAPTVNVPGTPSMANPNGQVIPVVPSYQVPPPTVYRVEPTVPYRSLPEKAYSHDHGR